MGYQKYKASGDQRYARFQRVEQRQADKEKVQVASVLLDLSNAENIPEPKSGI